VDEDLPRTLAADLRAAGLEAVDVRDVGLRGATDAAVHGHAVANGMTIVTADVEFGNVLRFPPSRHSGVVVARVPNEWPSPLVKTTVVAALLGLSDDEVRAGVVVIEPGRVRLRR
jgi:predicted nuclease of predicted toxin-antitoxin system